ncbi:MAG: hypothetical protein ACW98I_17980 [Candidatus Hodarchaeales archaeon]|jgi:hypothetical protein
MPATSMTFQLNQEYDDAVSVNEVKQKNLVVKKISPAEMKKSTPGFELALVVLITARFSAYMSRKRRKTN